MARLLLNGAKDILVQGMKEFEVQCLYDLQDVTIQLKAVNPVQIM